MALQGHVKLHLAEMIAPLYVWWITTNTAKAFSIRELVLKVALMCALRRAYRRRRARSRLPRRAPRSELPWVEQRRSCLKGRPREVLVRSTALRTPCLSSEEKKALQRGKNWKKVPDVTHRAQKRFQNAEKKIKAKKNPGGRSLNPLLAKPGSGLIWWTTWQIQNVWHRL